MQQHPKYFAHFPENKNNVARYRQFLITKNEEIRNTSRRNYANRFVNDN